ncbi:DJ-1/PfpI family protein [Desulfovibrio sp. TomC]|uniref:DJ-1/PfpI family protein n=1 Tax=Desulfovibrio sp. TomC TaxID=1562888 RepID=UPI00057382ED|nr:DJ-1/PfpI family protein [Desulfovibrio sp. TomC]KHK01025.1 ThiJ/PfpI family protein [Desulfovibrio sp. TomC]
MVRKKVAILIFPGVELLDFCGPYEVLSACRLDAARRREDPSPFEIVLAAETLEPVVCANGPRFLPDTLLADCPLPDVLLVPGGLGVRTHINNAPLIDWLRTVGSRVETLAGVCTGSMLLGKAGLLDGKRATTHFASLQWMRDLFPAITVDDDSHVVTDGRILTSAGISAGIDLAFRIVAQYYGQAVAQATARHMEYPYRTDNRRRY